MVTCGPDHFPGGFRHGYTPFARIGDGLRPIRFPDGTFELGTFSEGACAFGFFGRAGTFVPWWFEFVDDRDPDPIHMTRFRLTRARFVEEQTWEQFTFPTRGAGSSF